MQDISEGQKKDISVLVSGTLSENGQMSSTQNIQQSQEKLKNTLLKVYDPYIREEVLKAHEEVLEAYKKSVSSCLGKANLCRINYEAFKEIIEKIHAKFGFSATRIEDKVEQIIMHFDLRNI